MTLRYGFNEKGWGDKKKAEEKFKSLSEEDKEFYHQYLGMVLMAVDVSHISKDSIPVIIARHKAYPVLMGKIRKKLEDPEYLKRFIGYEANVTTITKIEFVNRLGRMNQALDKDTFLNNPTMAESHAKYVKELYGRDIEKESSSGIRKFFPKADIRGQALSFIDVGKKFDFVRFKNWKEKQEYFVIIKKLS